MEVDMRYANITNERARAIYETQQRWLKAGKFGTGWSHGGVFLHICRRGRGWWK